ncbi:MAG: CapA family protein [Alphaproteobacteria bacterium]|nr:CapA family protein [Alphaproteobacteria bacterium]
MRVGRRDIIMGAAALAVAPPTGRAQEAAELRLTVMGQALIQHDLRQYPWADYAELAAMFGRADLCFTDLETAIRNARADAPTREGVFLHTADPVVLDCLQDWHIGLLATSNNHAFDLGGGGIVGAIEELDRRGLAHAGSGADLAAAAAPAFCRTASGGVALIAGASGAIRDGGAATPTRPGVNELRVTGPANAAALDPADTARALDAVRSAAAAADTVIVYHHNHALTDKGHAVPDWQRDFAHRCIDAGASLFVSHGAPWLLGIELYKQRPIFYDLGSLVFQSATEAGAYDATAWQSVIGECRFVRNYLAELRLTPVQLNEQPVDGDLATRGRPSLAHGAEAATILDHLAGLSAPFGTQFTRTGDTATLRLT